MDELSNELIPTRATLLQRLKNWGDQSSWQDFFDTYWSLIYGFARKHGLTPAEAEDVVQETLLSVAKHMPAFKYDPAIGSFKAWLLKMTRWRISDQLRKRRPHELSSNSAEGEQKLENGSAREPDLEKLWDSEWETALLNAAVTKARRRLDPKQYQMFDLYVNKEWPPDRVAKLFVVPVGQVYLAKHRVTELIRSEVNRLAKEMV